MPEIVAIRKLLPDIQSEQDFRGHVIQKVGVTNIRYPLCFRSSSTTQPTVGTWQMFVSLPKNQRGAHMSRFMEILADLDGAQTIESLNDVCEQLRSRLSSDDAFLTVEFPWFIEKSAPVSGINGKLDFDVKVEVACRGRTSDSVLTLKVPATSLCPCSKLISEFGAHNQRCELTVAIRFTEGETLSVEELFRIAEESASAQVYSVVKRDDEKWVTEQAYKNPKFVEDTVRDLAAALQSDPRIRWYRCMSENFESIHNHNAFAQIEAEKDASR